MKILFFALVFSLTSGTAMAREEKATQFGHAAQGAVTSLFGKKMTG